MPSMRLAVVVLLLWNCLVWAQAAKRAAPLPPAKPTIAQKIAVSQSLLDLNTATPSELRVLPGMGDNYVKRIIDGRPYTAKNQLVLRGILPKAAYEAIKDQIVAHRPKH